MALKTLLITPSGDEKLWDNDKTLDKNRYIKAKDAFCGRFAGRSREYSERFYKGDWVILSPRYGFVLPDEEIQDYSAKTFAESGIEYDTIQINAESDALLNYERVIFLGSRNLHSEYIDIVSKVFSDKWVEYPLLESENNEAMLGRLIDSLTRNSPLRCNRTKIQDIEIRGLFSKYDHKIPFETEENLSIITAPNGYGKTTILRLIRAVFSGNLREIKDIPFNSVKITFDLCNCEGTCSKRTLEVVKNAGKTIGSKLPTGDFWSLIFRTVKGNGEVLEYTVNPDNFDEDETSWELSRIIPPVPVKFVSAQRLWQNADSENRQGDLLAGHGGGVRRTYELTILNYSEDIRQRIQAMLADYAASTQQLDSTYPYRYMDLCYELESGILPSAGSVTTRLSSLRLEQKKLKDLGFLSYYPQDAETGNICEEDISGEIGVLAALILYLDDAEKKYLIFDDLKKKIDLLLQIINSLFLTLSFEIRAEKGFYFLASPHGASFTDFGEEFRKGYSYQPDSEPVSPERLSSGEQNQLVMYYDLIFFTDPGTLVLIDEPEISLHIVWQRQYLDFIRRITNLTGSNFIIATHSPQLIHNNWDLTTDLSGGEIDG
ncbi:AAA family ATPase [Methanoplanus sp. FWC-SCC4]|uniref:AAA family ATPase n=1 Tax=Methanochimaera problematica TaxID=2609417 RepID=A0AA97FES5_9EURY|nr:AAA family ATPase [Methanoplanus sp. FWC-SCC4]WOF17222.1 AAA family ATPase [Methanoplanus sp. FWC-SCC4]